MEYLLSKDNPVSWSASQLVGWFTSKLADQKTSRLGYWSVLVPISIHNPKKLCIRRSFFGILEHCNGRLAQW